MDNLEDIQKATNTKSFMDHVFEFDDETKARENATAICKESYQQQEKEQQEQQKKQFKNRRRKSLQHDTK